METLPFVSVVMPVRNESAFVSRSIRSILNQTYPSERMEIIVADGMSDDDTRYVLLSIAQDSPMPLKIVDNPKCIAPAGLNRAIREAKGEIIVRVDGHCEIAPDYIANCVDVLMAGKAEGVGGPIDTVGETTVAKAIAEAMSSVFGVGGSAFRTVDDREMYSDTVAFPGYKRTTLDFAGSFNEELVRNQDDEYNYRIRKMGGRILLTPLIRSRYYSRSNFRSLWRQYFQYGYWKVRVLQMHPRQMSLRQFIPFVFVSSVLILIFLSFLSRFAALMLVISLVSYGVANLTSSVVLGIRRHVSIPSLILSFAILHFSYGIGFLAGLFAFSGKWRSSRGGLIGEN